MVKYLFLDIEGVMVSPKDRDLNNRTYAWDDFWIPDRTMELLKEIMQLEDVRIIITSDWRKTPDAMRYVYHRFDEYGFELWTELSKGFGQYKEELIRDWTDRFDSIVGDKPKYAVLDDENLSVNNLVRTDSYYGLISEDIKKVIKIFTE